MADFLEECSVCLLTAECFMGICQECWDEINETYELGVKPIERAQDFDDD